MKLQLNDINQVLRDYDLGIAKAAKRLTSGYTNINYQITTDKDNYLYRIYAEKPVEDILYEIRLMESLKQVKFPTAFPIKRKNDKFVTNTKFGSVLIYQFIAGNEPAINKETVKEIASAVAKLNSFKNWRKFRKKNPQDFNECQKIIKKFPTAKNKYPELFEYFIEETKFLSKALNEKVHQGLVHGDVFPDNTIFKENKLAAIIDFEEACTDNLLYDIGVTINGFCFIENNLDQKLLTIFLTEYNKIRKLSGKEERLLPYYIQWGAHAMIGWHLSRLLGKKLSKNLRRANYLMRRVQRLRKINIS